MEDSFEIKDKLNFSNMIDNKQKKTQKTNILRCMELPDLI